LRARGLPLVSLESHLPLADFHVLGFSLQYELTYTNLLTMLELGRVPLRAAASGPRHPLVIAGGPCAFNPEPLAPFLDGVLLGDGEEAVGDICDRVLAWDGRDRGALLRALADVPGFYVPAFFAPRYHADGTIAEVVPLEPAGRAQAPHPLRGGPAPCALDRRLQRCAPAAEGAAGPPRPRARGGLAPLDPRRRALAAHPGADPPRAEDGLHARARGRHAAPARRDPEGVPRGGAAPCRAPVRRPRLAEPEALLHDRAAERDRGGRARHRRAVGTGRGRGRRAPAGDGQRLHLLAQAAHALPVGGAALARGDARPPGAAAPCARAAEDRGPLA